MKFLTVILLLGIFSTSQAAFVLHCIFSGDSRTRDYTCTFNNAIIDFLTDRVTITGQHLSGHTDDDVRIIEFRGGNTWLTHIPNQIFDRFRNIVTADVSNSNLQRIAINSLRNCNSLTSLNIANNNLRGFPRSSIMGCQNLQIIDAKHNQITEVVPGLLRNQRNFVKLHLGWNQITQLRSGVLDTASPQRGILFDFSNNPIRRIEGGFNATASIGRFSCWNCTLDEIDPTFVESLTTGRIESLDLRINNCVDAILSNVSLASISEARRVLWQCFTNFISSK